MLVVVSTNGASINAPTDNQGTAYRLVKNNSGTGFNNSLFYASPIAAGVTSLTLSFGTSCNSSYIIREYQGLDNNQFFATGSNVGFGTFAASPYVSNLQLAFGWCGYAGAYPPTVGAGYTDFVAQTDGTSCGVAVEDMKLDGIDLIDAYFNFSANTHYTAGVAFFEIYE
jgi:hypothetical protein